MLDNALVVTLMYSLDYGESLALLVDKSGLESVLTPAINDAAFSNSRINLLKLKENNVLTSP